MKLLVFALLWSQACVPLSSAHPQHNAFSQVPALPQGQHFKGEQQRVPVEERVQVNTVKVTCHPDLLEIVVEADMFGIGVPVNGHELRLGVEENDFCRATASSGDRYRILVGLTDCGTKHWMTEENLVYTNLLIYSPMATPDGLTRMEEAVVPIECHYERKYSLSSSPIAPTWVPFMSSEAAEETLSFNLWIMTDDWLYKRGSNVFFFGDSVNLEVSVDVGHHTGLKVFVSSCVATLSPDIYSVPRYAFVENGCLLDSQLPGSRSHFLPRVQNDKLLMAIDAFRFHNEDRRELYITCHLNAVPTDDAELTNKACTFANGRWYSAEGSDYLCGYCRGQNEATATHGLPSHPGKFGPRGFGKVESEPMWRSGLKKSSKVFEQEARAGPLLILPAARKSGPLPENELPPLLTKSGRAYGSRWRGVVKGEDDVKGLPDPATPSRDEEMDEKSGTALTDAGENEVEAEVMMKSKDVDVRVNGTADSSETGPSTRVELAPTSPPNATALETDLSDTTDPKR